MIRSSALVLAVFAALFIFAGRSAQAQGVRCQCETPCPGSKAFNVSGTTFLPGPPFRTNFSGTFIFLAREDLAICINGNQVPGLWEEVQAGGVSTFYFAFMFNGHLYTGSATAINGIVGGSASSPAAGVSIYFTGQISTVQ